jgi:hypothetical protein
MTPSNIRVLLPRPTVVFGIASILILLVSPFEQSINGEAMAILGHTRFNKLRSVFDSSIILCRGQDKSCGIDE